MDSYTQTLTILILLLALVVTVIVTQFIRRRRDLFALRPLAAYDQLPMLVGEAIEADRPLHLSLGSAGLGGTATVLTVASAELVYQVAQRAATGAINPIITLSDTGALPLAQDTLRRAYRSRGRLDNYRATSIHWFPSGSQSLAFAAAVMGTMGDDDVSSHVLAGSYGLELALIGHAAARRDQSVIATSDRLDGQAIAYTMADRPLLGEELFAAGAYLEGKPAQVGAVVALEVLRALLILVIVIPTAVAIGDYFTAGRFTQVLSEAYRAVAPALEQLIRQITRR